MRNLWIFISKYNAFFLFVIFFVTALILTIKNNSYQRASVLNSSNQVIGEAYRNVNAFKSYLRLGAVNDSLARENARLRNQLKSSFYNDSIAGNSVKDTLYKQQYTYIVARVVNNSIHQKNNYITINRGKRQGVQKGMGVICGTGVVGIVLNVSDNFASVRTILHSETKISASIAGTGAFGSLVWGDNNYDPQKAVLEDIPNHITVKPGAQIVTSGYSLFPAGLPIGKVIKTGVIGGNNFLNIEVKLSTDFATLEYVYVVNNLFSTEQAQLEESNKKDE
ncbi:rod shape-determining protein MreC [Pedobacter sp. BS3]|uniref:rod shape-determining protein MreC n=1 Tax=Pedobacter sp. BS3 TaxID=2567937 RepID=UPI0011ED4AF6|nr:rod shape-determining protein MreC [Pedobacter sp. BS3]TZF82068.1 rod shape-determining protein MreC [Pedobacter sp. BS3]